MSNELLEKIESLESEVNLLKSRVSELETRNNGINLPGPGEVKVPLQVSPRDGQHKLWTGEVKNKLTRENLENAIGGKLLNRVGIVVLLFGVAYFLKYSFDNQWIGEVGRVVIGFLAGISLLVAGDLVMRRDYSYFSQGLTGGGIGVIYLTTFAAANFYFLISSGTAFALLVLTALSGGLLAVRQNAFAVAVLSTLGGFLSPFLIGSTEANQVVLLSYIAVLDLAVLCLAYYKNWRSLNLLAFFGTCLVYLVYQATSWHSSLEVMWLNQAYLTLYFVIFATLTFLYNVKHQQPTKAPEIVLLVLNAAFFFTTGADNLDSHYHSWLGLFAIFLAASYLTVGVILNKRKKADNFLFLALLGTGLAFVTIAIPLQLEDDRIIASAWLVEAIILFYAGLKGGNIWVRRAGLALLTLVTFSFQGDYYYFNEQQMPLLNYYSLASAISVIGFFFVAHMFYHHQSKTKVERLLVWPAAVIGTFLAIKQLSWEVTTAIAYFKLDYAEAFAISLSWLVFAVFLMIMGMTRDLKGMRFISLALFCITTFKIMILDLSGLDMAFRILILLIVGAVLIGVSFVYQRKESKGGGV